MNLADLVRSLDNPRDYFQGYKSSLSSLPDNVLLFKRNNPIKQGARSYHHRHVLICNLAGRGTVIVDGRIHILKPRHGILVFPFQGHEYGMFAPGGICWLFVTFDLQEYVRLRVLRNNSFALDSYGLRLLSGLTETFLAAQKGDAEKSGILGVRVVEILAHLTFNAEKFIRKVEAEPDSPRLNLVRRTVAHIHENLERHIGVADVAKHVCLSPSRLRAVFKEEVGVSLGEFIARCQINRACALLGRSDMNVSEVARAGGFESVYSFSRAFKRRRGVSPRRYRAGLRETKFDAQHALERPSASGKGQSKRKKSIV